jgi:hypothetical protein
MAGAVLFWKPTSTREKNMKAPVPEVLLDAVAQLLFEVAPLGSEDFGLSPEVRRAVELVEEWRQLAHRDVLRANGAPLEAQQRALRETAEERLSSITEELH